MKCIEGEIPFEVPEGWEWCRLRSITYAIGDGLHGTPTYDDNGKYYFINGTNLLDGKITIKADTKRISHNVYCKLKKPLNTDSILVSINGTLGNTAFFNGENVALGKSACYINSIFVNKYYLRYIFLSDYFRKYAVKKATGSTIKNLGLDAIRNLFIPIPQLNEMNMIVSKLGVLLNIEESITLDKKDISNLIINMKSKVLTLAIQGKLISQNPNDEPASILLERIRAEKEELIKAGKIKRDKKESFIYQGDDNSYYEKIGNEVKCIDNEVPFKIPKNWRWVRFKTIASLKSGTTYPSESELAQGEKLYVKVSDMNLEENTLEIKTSSRYLNKYNPKHLIPRGSVIFPKRGGAILTNKKKLVLQDSILVDLNTMSFTPDKHISLMYCFYWFSSIDLRTLNHGSNIPQINNIDIEPLFFPLPPYNEQIAIVKQIQMLQFSLKQITENLR